MCAIVGLDLGVGLEVEPQDLKFTFEVKAIDGVCGRNISWISCVLGHDRIAFVDLNGAVGKLADALFS